MAQQRTYLDPVIELAGRLGGDPGDIYDLASQVSDEEAELVLEVLDEVEAEEAAAGIAGRLRRQGHIL